MDFCPGKRRLQSSWGTKGAMVSTSGTDSDNTPADRPPTESHHRKIIITEADILHSPLLERLAEKLRSLQGESGKTKPEYAEFLGVSGSQFRYLRRRLTNPSIHSLAHISKQVRSPLYELLESKPLENRRRPSGPQMSKRFGDVVSRFYAASGLSKQEFADRIDVGFSQLYVIMKGDSNPSLLVAEQIAKRLGITLWQLLGVESMDGHSYALPKAGRKRRK
jgi:transcriptional regulator with XRE-family HTH domain